VNINGMITSQDVAPGELLISLLRRSGCASVKSGCESGDCGACTVLVDGVPRPSCVMLALQAGGCTLTTVEGISNARQLHPLQQAFIETGATRCGFCTPGMLLSAYALLQRNPSPGEQEVRDALSGNLCRCSGYTRSVQAVLRAAALMREEPVEVPKFQVIKQDETQMKALPTAGNTTSGRLPALARRGLLNGSLRTVGKPLPSIDGTKFITGKPVFTADAQPQGMLYGRVLTSPHAHAVIRNIDTSHARALSGVHAVLTYKDIMTRRPYTSILHAPASTAPRDRYILDYLMRYAGDRVAVVAAETPELAEEALQLIEVEYDILPAVLDPRQAAEQNAPHIHPESESQGIFDAQHNIAARTRLERGDVERGFAESDRVIEGEYSLPLSQQTTVEKHVVLTYFDEDDNLLVRTNTQVPGHVQRTLAALLEVPASRVKVVQVEAGGDTATKQEIVLEDLCALLTIATNRPVMLAHTRADEFAGGGARAPYIIRMKTGVKNDGTLIANQMVLLTSTGAYATHPLIGQRQMIGSALSLYPCAHMRYAAEILYTNLPPAGAYQERGAFQEVFAVESHMDEIARQLGMDALELRRKNWISVGSEYPFASEHSRHGASVPVVESCGLSDCVRIVEEQLNWRARRSSGKQQDGPVRRGVGVALAMHGYNSVQAQTGGAIIKLNEDGTFDIFTGAIDAGSGTRTVLAQMAAEILGVAVERVSIHTSDPVTAGFNAGTTPTGTLYTSGEAVFKAADQMRRQVLAVAGRMLNVVPESLKVNDGSIISARGQQGTLQVTLQQVAAHSIFEENRYLIITASAKMQSMPITFTAQGVEVEVDSETGMVRILRVVSAIDAGRTINPLLTEAQVQGSVMRGLSMALGEELLYDQQGHLLTTNLRDYHAATVLDIPESQVYLVETIEPTTPFGVKSVADVPCYGSVPALANAVADALGIRIRQLPLTPERVLRAIHAHAVKQT
jgi:putative selenate reductase molybdopterin-binding subunit